MSSNSRLVTAIFCTALFPLGSAFGQPAAIEADVKGVDGRPAKSAEVRIERQDKKMAPMIVKTNWRGHLSATNLEVGTYKLTATVAGGVQSSQIVKTQVQKPGMVTIDLSKTPALVNKSKSKKRMVWVPAPTGSMIGGGWVEVNDDGSVKPGTNTNGQNLNTVGSGELARMQNRSFAAPAVGGR